MPSSENLPFIHLLITRFNIQVKGHGPERMESPPMTSSWLQERLDLFARYCAPSVAAQTETCFIWLWYLDPSTPESFVEQLRGLIPSRLQVDIRYARDYEDMLADTRSYIRSMSSSFVITTRLDNDDMISFDFMEKVQAAFIAEERTIINFLAGYEYGSRDHILKRWNVRYMNQFISLIESTRAEELLTIYQFPHWKIPAGARIVNIGGPPYWIYLRHALNYSEQKINAIPVFRKSGDLFRFPSFAAEARISTVPTLRYAVAWLPKTLKRRLRRLFQRG